MSREQTPHPNKEGGHSFGDSSPSCVGMQEEALHNRCFWFGVDLYNHSYYWEAHVWWEALWHRSRKDRAWDAFFKGLIKIAAGALKMKMGRAETARDLWRRAQGLLLRRRRPPPGRPRPGEGRSGRRFFAQMEHNPRGPLPLREGVSRMRTALLYSEASALNAPVRERISLYRKRGGEVEDFRAEDVQIRDILAFRPSRLVALDILEDDGLEMLESLAHPLGPKAPSLTLDVPPGAGGHPSRDSPPF